MSLVVEKVEMVERGLAGPKGETGDVTPEATAAKDAAESSRDAAAISENNASASEAAAAGSALVASGSASAAATSESNASASEAAAAGSALAASGSASAAATSESNASVSETAAADSALDASGSAIAAATSESNAAASETAAGNSATAAAGSASAAATSESNAAASEIAAGDSATAAAGSASAAAASESNAAASETAAGDSATAAAGSASAAAASESNAAASETAAGNSATAAAGSASAAATAAVTASAAAMGVQNHLPTVAEFESLAANRRNQFAGSGFVEWGKHGDGSYPGVTSGVNEGLWVRRDTPNTIRVGSSSVSAIGSSSLKVPTVLANGCVHTLNGVLTEATDNNNILLPPSLATAALLDRQDLVFVEAWHEDISEKDFVYPYGNVQFGPWNYTSPGGTVFPCVNGAFSGYGTYSLFGNWQTSGALIGKGKVWSTMTDAQKRSFVADPQNNMYLDGDKIIQVRYRIRVIAGLGSSWGNANITTGDKRFVYEDLAARVKPKGKFTVIGSDLGAYNTDRVSWYTTANHSDGKSPFSTAQIGAFQATDGDSTPDTGIAHRGLCFAIPMCIVHRRNQGAFHPVWNPNGTAMLNGEGGGGNYWYVAGRYIPTSVVDCFDGYYQRITTGAISNAVSGRPDGLFYDEINERDIFDLRNSAHKVEDYKRLLEREFNKCVAGTMRGWEQCKNTEVQDIGDVNGLRFRYSANFDLATTLFHAGNWSSAMYRGAKKPIFLTDTLYSDVAVFIPLSNGEVGSTLQAAFWLSDGSNFPTGATSIESILKSRLSLTTLGDDGSNFRSYNELRVINLIDASFSSKTLLCCDIIGDPANYPQAWKDNGVMGTPLLVGENGENLAPDGTSKTFKMSRKVKTVRLVVYSTDGGDTWLETTSTWSTDLTGASNSKIATVPSGRIYLVFYNTEASPLDITANAEILALGLVRGSANNEANYGNLLTAALIGKVATGYGYRSIPASCVSIHPDNKWFATNGGSYNPSHAEIPSAGGFTATSPAAKVLPYITRANGKAYLNMLYKEMINNGTSWGDDSRFNVVDNESTTTDLNGQIVKIGQKRIELPYFIGAGE